MPIPTLEPYQIIYNDDRSTGGSYIKSFISPTHNYEMDMVTGIKTYVEPYMSYNPYGPEQLDCEISSKCYGPNGSPCVWCYKGSTPGGSIMAFETFVDLFNKLPQSLATIAFQVNYDATSNPDFWKILDYCKNNSYNRVAVAIIVAHVSQETANRLGKYINTAGVSRYADKDLCYNSVQYLINAGVITGVTVIGALENYNLINEVIDDLTSPTHADPRLARARFAIWMLKKCGRGLNYTELPPAQLQTILQRYGQPLSYDRCSAKLFFDNYPYNSINFDTKPADADAATSGLYWPCRQFLFNVFVNANGDISACFWLTTPQRTVYPNIMNISAVTNFFTDVWYHPDVERFRADILYNLGAFLPCVGYNEITTFPYPQTPTPSPTPTPTPT